MSGKSKGAIVSLTHQKNAGCYFFIEKGVDCEPGKKEPRGLTLMARQNTKKAKRFLKKKSKKVTSPGGNSPLLGSLASKKKGGRWKRKRNFLT